MPVYEVALGEVTARITSTPDTIARTLRLGKFYEEDLLLALTPYLSPDKCAIDVGGHVGNHTIYFANFGPVLSIEPTPSNYALLLETIAGSPRRYRVDTANCAASDGDANYQAIINPDNSGNTKLARHPGGEIESVTIDSLDLDAVSVIKIDVEGMEPAVLRGAIETIKRCQPVLAIEAKTPAELEAVKAVLTPLGYRCGQRYCASATYLFHPRTK